MDLQLRNVKHGKVLIHNKWKHSFNLNIPFLVREERKSAFIHKKFSLRSPDYDDN
jgi:hypothetical protein